jgi:adenosine deaminase
MSDAVCANYHVAMPGLPKIELHLHLDCAASHAAVARLRPEITIEQYRADFIAPAKCTNLVDFLLRPPRIVALMQDRRGLETIVEDLFDQLARDGVVYAEVRFAPHLHTEAGLDPAEVVEIVNAAVERASAESGVAARLILCTLRHYDAATSLQTVELVERFRGSRVVALDIAGDEAGYPLDAHEAAFRFAEEHDLRRTAHAGEAAGAASVWETLRRLRPERIGHGARSIEDPDLVEHLIAAGIHLEVCPSSNVQTNLCDTYAEHPIDALYRQGVSLGVNTDGRAITDITLEREYERLRATFGWTDDDLMRCNMAALEASFAPPDLRTQLRSRIGGHVPA